jgi:SAM-dependent methyltransferase
MLYGSHVEKEKIAAFKQALLSTKPALKSLIEGMEFEYVTHCWCGGLLEKWLPDFYPYDVCIHCGCKSVRVRQTADSLNIFYSDRYWYEYQTIHDCPSIEERYERDMIDRIPIYLQWIQMIQSRPSRTLEVGCGNGRLLYELTLMGYQCSASEMDHKVAKWVKEKTGVPIFVGSFPPAQDGNYDLILLIDVLEHMYYPVGFVQEVRSRLKRGGKVMLHCPVIDDDKLAVQMKYLFNPLSHLWMHTIRSITDLWKTVGLHPRVIGELFGMPCFVIEELK